MPDPDVFQCDHWPQALQKPGALKHEFRKAAQMLRATRARTPGGKLPKYDEFASWAKGIGLSAKRARIAVNFVDRMDNGHGVQQKACKNCGDCFTGCNHDAKNTLPMNYLWRARAMGARLFTGITVSHLTPAEPLGKDQDAAGWRVHFSLTSRKRKKASIVAKQVILAAGALGSTEILLRSREEGLLLSKRLGRRFSCNGDMIGSPVRCGAYSRRSSPRWRCRTNWGASTTRCTGIRGRSILLRSTRAQ
jgi:cholesterol oxidase